MGRPNSGRQALGRELSGLHVVPSLQLTRRLFNPPPLWDFLWTVKQRILLLLRSLCKAHTPGTQGSPFPFTRSGLNCGVWGALAVPGGRPFHPREEEEEEMGSLGEQISCEGSISAAGSVIQSSSSSSASKEAFIICKEDTERRFREEGGSSEVF